MVNRTPPVKQLPPALTGRAPEGIVVRVILADLLQFLFAGLMIGAIYALVGDERHGEPERA
jgi:hypothetical protein